MNETAILENENNTKQDVLSSETSDVTTAEDTKEEQTKDKEQDTTAPEQTGQEEESSDTVAMVEQVTQINQQLGTVTNILLVSMVGIGILVGITACNIFSRYFKS